MLLLNIDGDITHLTFTTFFSKQNGKHDEGWMILKQVHDTNMRAKGHPEKVFSVSICDENNQQSFWQAIIVLRNLLYVSPLKSLSNN